MALRIAAARSWLKTNPDTAAAAFFILLLTSPSLLELLILRPSVPREMIVLGISFFLWILAAASVSRRTGLTARKAWTFLKAGGRLWELLLLAGWMAVLVVNAAIGRGINPHVPLGYFAFFTAVYLIDLFYAMTGRQDRQRWILYLIYIVFAVACVRGATVLATDPEVSRNMSTGSFPEVIKRQLHMRGVGSYEFFTGLACVFPMLVYYRMTARRFRFFTVCICLILTGMLFAGFTLMIVFTGFGLFLLLVYSLIRTRGKELRILSRLCAILLAVIILFIGVGRLFNLHQSHLYLIKLSDITVTMADRLFDVQIPFYNPGPGNESLLTERSSGERIDLYGRSVKTMLAHPLFGLGSRVNSGDFSLVGQHASWLDYLAMFGIPWFGLYLGFIVLMFRRVRKMKADNTEKAYRTVALTVYVLYGFVNPIIATAMFPVVLLFFITGRVRLPGEERAGVPADDGR